MQAIRLLVARYGDIAARSGIARASVAAAIAEVCGVRVEPAEVEIGEGEVRVRVSGTRRAAVFLKQEKAAAAAAAALGKLTLELR